MMRLWLEKAGVFSSGWSVNETRLREVLGASTEEVEVLAKLTPEQRTYLKTLANMGGAGPYLSNDVEKLASATYGISFNEKNLPKQVLYPLENAGYVTVTRGTRTLGRGAKPFIVSPTNKFVADLIAPLLEQLEKQTQWDLRSLLRKPLPEILKEMKSGDKHVRGLALEALAFKLMRLLDMTYVATRLRGTATGGAEVDVIFESSRLVFSRWQIQCKNTARVTLDDVAKEVGLAYFLNTNVIVVATPGRIDPQVRRYVEVTERVRRLGFVLLDGKALVHISQDPAGFIDEIVAQAQSALCRVDQFSFPMMNRRANAPTSARTMDVAV
jgi:site-specific DNA-methyltransferase (cytosine-N4-specific)